MSGGGAVPRAARVRFKPRAAAVFGAGYTYDIQNENIEIAKFSFSLKNVDFLNKESIVVEIKATDEKYNGQINALCLKNIYKYHNDIVFDIIRKENVFNDTYVSGLLSDFKDLFSSKQEIKEWRIVK